MRGEIKRLGKHTIAYFIATIFGKMAGFIMIPLYTRFLSPKDYGTIELLDLTGYVISFFLSMGLANAFLRYYFYYQDEKDRNEVISTSVLFSLPCSFLIVAVIFFFSGLLSRVVLGPDVQSIYFRILSISLFFESLLNLFLTYLRVLEKVSYFVAMTLGKLALSLFLNVYFIAILKIGILGFLFSSVISSALFSGILATYTLARTGFSFSGPKLKQMLAFGVPLIPASVFELALHYSDRYFLSNYGSLNDVGIYALGYKFGMLVSVLLVAPFGMMWGVNMYVLEKNPQAGNIHARVLTYFLLTLSAGGLIISLFIKDILKIMTTPAFYPAYTIVPYIAVSYIFFGMYQVVKSGLFIKNKTWRQTLILLSAALLNVMANLFLIRSYNIMGAAIATLITFFYLLLLTGLLSGKVYQVRYENGRILKIAGVGFLIFSIGYPIELGYLMDILLKSGLIIGFPICLYALDFFDEEEKVKIHNVWMRSLVVLRSSLQRQGIIDK